MTPGIHLLHKPVGPTSFSVVQACLALDATRPGKRRKLCHGGTLDPFACGLLLILVEPATRLFDHLHAIPKVYEATVRWGVETDNGDPLGHPVFAGDPSPLSPARLDNALTTFIGWRDQTPPATSAIRIDGERAYVRAHRGETFDMPTTKVYLHEARWLSHDLPRESRLRLTVRGGYYVRALARDLGRLLGCGAHLSHLHRTAIGPWQDPGVDQRQEVHGREVMPWSPVRILTDQEIGDLRQSRAIPTGTLLAADWPLPAGFAGAEIPVRAFHLGRFVYLLAEKDGQLRAVAALPGGV